MERDEEIHIEGEEARAASSQGVVRYVLGISLLLAIVAMTLVWVIPAMQETDVETAGTASERVEEMRENDVPPEEIPGLSDDNPDKEPTSAQMSEVDE